MSSPNLWRYLINTFEVNTVGSHVKMNSIATDTHAKLKAEESDPLIADTLVVFEPVFLAYRSINQQFNFRVGDYRGATLGFENIIDSVPQVIRAWESGVRAVYIEDTPEERAIFPNKRAPFEKGTYEDRLDAIGALATKTSGIPALAGVGAQVTSFYNMALASRLAQQTDEGSVGQISDLRENQRLLLSKEMMGVLGKLMFIHRFNLVEVERYFDLSLLRRTGEEPLYYEAVAPIGISLIEPDFELANATADTLIKIKSLSEGTQVLTFYFSPTNPNLPVPPLVLVLNAGQEQTVNLGQLGFPNQFFLVQNSGPTAGKFSIEVEEE